MPAAALGASAKFRQDGRTERGRYHVALSLPCGATDRALVADSGLRAAKVLEAPPLVSEWAEVLRHHSVATAGFGYAKLSEASAAGKVYVMTKNAPLPPLPLGRGLFIDAAVPTAFTAAAGHMVSLEWALGQEQVDRGYPSKPALYNKRQCPSLLRSGLYSSGCRFRRESRSQWHSATSLAGLGEDRTQWRKSRRSCNRTDLSGCTAAIRGRNRISLATRRTVRHSDCQRCHCKWTSSVWRR